MGGKTRYAIVHGREFTDQVRRLGPNKRGHYSASHLFERTPLNDSIHPLSPPPGFEVKESGTFSRRGSFAESITVDALAACTEIAEVVAEYDLHREVHETKIRRLLDILDAGEINNLRYRLFAPHYDKHMRDHEAAIRLLLQQIPAIERLSSPLRPPLRMIADDVLELSCGTGTVPKILGDVLPIKRASALNLTANDLSDDMKAIAMEKLAGFPGTIGFTGQDINRLDLGRKFGTIILSQTLHLITDEDVVRQERQENYLHVDTDRHFEAKLNVIANAWRHLELGGTLLVIDEWPALLSDRGGPLGPGFTYLFNDSLREIGYMDFGFSIMGLMPGSRLVTHLKTPIDSKHAMYVLVYRKEDWDRANPSVLPQNNGNSELRDQTVRRVIAVFKTINHRFIDGFRAREGDPWVRFRSMNPKKMRVYSKGEVPDEESKYNGVVLDRMLHTVTAEERHELIKSAIRALKVGGSLLFIDEWPINITHEHPIEISDLKMMYMKRYAKNLAYGGALRLPIHDYYDSGMFGFQFWKVM